jgi:L-iditol 2-dehydrogenase
MRAYHVTAPGALELREIESPRAGPGELVLDVRAALTCGTDLKLLRRGHPKMPFPTRMGHEFAGVVVEAGDGAPFGIGDEVMSVHTAPCGTCALCRKGSENLCDEAMSGMVLGAFADRILLPARITRVNTFLKPAGLPWEHAAFLEPLACCVHGVQAIDVREGEDVVVIGAGPIALLHVVLARARGARRVVVVGRRAARLQAARSVGADVVIDEQACPAEETLRAVRRATGGLGGDVVIECAATPEAWEVATAYARRGGRVLWFGGCKPGTSVTLDTQRMHYDEITAMGVFHFTPRSVVEARRLLVERAIDVAPLLSGSVPLTELPAAFERIGRGEGVKYAIVP